MTTPFACPSTTGPGPCKNETQHTAPLNCVHWSSTGSWVNDRHDRPDRGDGE